VSLVTCLGLGIGIVLLVVGLLSLRIGLDDHTSNSYGGSGVSGGGRAGAGPRRLTKNIGNVSWNTSVNLSRNLSWSFGDSSSINANNNSSGLENDDVEVVKRLWMVVCAEGVDIVIDVSNHINHMGFGSVLIGNNIDLLLAETSKFRVFYPYSGYVSLETAGKCLEIMAIPDKPQVITAAPTTAPTISPVITATCANEQTYVQDMDFKGGDVMFPPNEYSPDNINNNFVNTNNPVNVHSHMECCHVCARTPQCSAFTFTVQDQNCWLKHLGFKESKMASAVSGKLSIPAHLSPVHSLHQPRPLLQLHQPSVLPSCCGAMSQDQNGHEKSTTFTYSPQYLRTLASAASNGRFLRIHKQTLGWTEQFPIGTGRVGALAGGSMEAEIVPISIAGLFVRQAGNDKTSDEVFTTKMRANMKSARDLFRSGKVLEAQQAITAQDISFPKYASFQYLADLAFVYSPEPLAIITTPPPVAPTNAQTQQPPPKQRPNIRPLMRNGPGMMFHGSRERIVQSFKSRLGPMGPPTEAMSAPEHAQPAPQGQEPAVTEVPGGLNRLRGLFQPLGNNIEGNNQNNGNVFGNKLLFDDVFLSEGVLDMEAGVSTHTFAARHNCVHVMDGTGSGTDHCDVYVHQREWFASSVDDVLVGSLSCTKLVEETSSQRPADGIQTGSYVQAEGSAACLNVALGIGRAHNPNMVPAESIGLETIDEHSNSDVYEILIKSKNLDRRSKFQAVRVDVALASQPGVSVLPSVHMCAILVCLQGEFDDENDPSFVVDQQMHTVICNSAHSMKVLLSADLFDDSQEATSTHQQSVKDNCWERMLSALQFDVIQSSELKQRHVHQFTEYMHTASLSLETPPLSAIESSSSAHAGSVSATAACPHDYLDKQLDMLVNPQCLLSEQISSSSSSAAAAPEPNSVANVVSTQPFVAAYNFGRYLLFAGGTQSVLNLQGIHTAPTTHVCFFSITLCPGD
jgi:hypothetical protein